jgi:SAM-dependent methyltransferase
MKDAGSWVPSKYITTRGQLRASRDTGEVNVASRLVADLVAGFYQDAIPAHAYGSLLDLGCGKAPLYATYAPVVSQTVCVDWENSLHPNPHLDLTHDLTEPLPFASESFGTVILSDVLEHMRRPVELISEIARVLEPGGVLLMNVPFLYWLHETPHDYYRYTRFALSGFADDAGLEVVTLRSIGGAPLVLGDLVSKLLAQFGSVGSWLAALVQRLTSAFTRSGLGRQFSDRTAEVWPIGYAMVARKLPVP